MNDRQKLKTFWERASKYSGKSEKCYLDGRYFNRVLGFYPGTIQEPMRISIQDNLAVSSSNDEDMDYAVAFASDEYAIKNSSGPIRLFKLIIEIGKAGTPNGILTHSNLIWVDMRKKKVCRFEPMMNHPYSDVIQSTLMNYFKGLKGFKFVLVNQHPQMLNSEKCAGRGMCSAFVLMQAMKILTEKDHIRYPTDPKKAEDQILRFAYAIEKDYGQLPGEPEYEYGYKANWKKFKAGVKKSWAETKQKGRAARAEWKAEDKRIQAADAARKAEAARLQKIGSDFEQKYGQAIETMRKADVRDGYSPFVLK